MSCLKRSSSVIRPRSVLALDLVGAALVAVPDRAFVRLGHDILDARSSTPTWSPIVEPASLSASSAAATITLRVRPAIELTTEGRCFLPTP